MRRLTSTVLLTTLVLSAGSAHADALLSERSHHSVADTIARVESAAKANGFTVIAKVDHAAAAEKAGMTLPPTTVLFFGKPQAGTPLIACDPRVGFDLPLRALSWQDPSGQVWLAMLNPAELKARYDLPSSCDAPLAAMGQAVRGFLSEATK